MKYEEMLSKAIKEIPESVHERDRFEIPKAIGHIQGNRTIINNFRAIADTLRRNPEHLLKYVLKELATPGNLTRTSLLIGAKVPASRINEKIKQYANEFVLCKQCGKPDTKIEKEGAISNRKCSACGAKYVVRSKI